ncbi:MAG: peptidyl-prolyl cis-trans isomerase [Actinomycetota bacterium]|nr:peptidyl-prolyl cis-trans isomerase [Actinomycetota bacterium]
MTDLEQLFHSAAAFAEEGHPPPGDPVATLSGRRAARRRRRLAVLAVPLAAMTTVAVAVVPTALSKHHGGHTPIGTADPAPASFAALTNGHAGIYDASSGDRLRDLGAAVAVSAATDGVWLAEAQVCASTLRFVPSTSGAVSSEQRVDGRVGTVAASPDGRTLAYSVGRSGDPNPDVLPCGSADLVLLDVATGTKRVWTAAAGSGEISQLSWSADGSHLAFQTTACCDATATLHDLAVDTAPTPITDVPAPLGESQKCDITLPAFQKDQLVAIRQCDTKSELVEVDTHGRVTPIRDLPPEKPIALAAAGDTLLVSTYGTPETPGTLFRVEPDGTTSPVGTGLSQPSWVGNDAVASPPPTRSCTYRVDPQDAVGRDVGVPPSEPGQLPQRVTLHTNRGDVTIEFGDRVTATPCTVNSFVHLARTGYYDSVACHRLTTQGIYVVQCGDPSGKGTGGPGYRYDDESLTGTTYPEGAVGMANSGPGTNGSQFFLVYKDTQLDPNYTVFGRVVAGLDVLRGVADGGSTPAGDGKPKLPLEITGVTIG